VFALKKERAADLNKIQNDPSIQDKRREYISYRRIFNAEALVLQFAAIIGWQNPNASKERLERLLTQECNAAVL